MLLGKADTTELTKKLGVHAALEGKLLRWPNSSQMATNTWINFVNDCELFSVAPNCVPTGVGAGQTLDQCKRPNENVGFFLTSGKASFLNSVYGYGTGFVPNVGAGWETVAAEGAVSCSTCALSSCHHCLAHMHIASDCLLPASRENHLHA